MIDVSPVPTPANWTPEIRVVPLAMRVLAIARTRVEGTWAAYIDAVPGQCHGAEYGAVLDQGAKLAPEVAAVLFPEFKGIPYAR